MNLHNIFARYLGIYKEEFKSKNTNRNTFIKY